MFSFPKHMNKIFGKVVFIGPDKRGRGGMASVLASYAENFTPFHYLASNSCKGTLAGVLRTLTTLAVLPLMRVKGYKIAHIHYASGKSWQRKKIIAKIAKVFGFKIVMHCHSGTMKLFCETRGHDYIRKTLNIADANVVLSHSWLEYFKDTLKCNNVFVVNNIINRPVQINNKHNEIIEFLFLGSIDERKGIFDALQAFERLAHKGLKFRLVVGGNGDIDRFRNELKARKLDNFVDFKGWISGDDKEDALNNCDILILPSYNEGLPISILEAMARRKAVISTPVGGIPEIIQSGYNGILVTPGNINEIEKAMETYILNPWLIEKHGQSSFDIIKDYFPEAVETQLNIVYSKIINSY